MSENRSYFKPIPTVPEPPIIKSFLATLTSESRFRQEVRKAGPDIARFHVGPYTFVLVARADLCQEVLLRTEEFDKTPTTTAVARPVFGNGLLFIENHPHRAHRRIIQPAFNHSRIYNYGKPIVEETLKYSEQWSDGQVVDISKEMTALTMRIIGKIMFDLDDLGDEGELGSAITTMFDYLKTAFLLPVPLSWPLPHNIRARQATAFVDRMIYDTIERQRRAPSQKGELLSLLLEGRDENGRGLTDKEIRDEAMGILVAGHETIAYTLAFALYLLSKHPAARGRLEQEVKSVLQGRPPSMDDLPKLTFTTQVFKETLRLFPAAHALPRQATQDTTLGGYEVKKDWFVGVDVWGMHRRADYFPNPQRFDPYRFSSEREAQIPRNAYIPFGSGPRNCIGRGLAMIEGPLILATLAQHFRIEVEPNTPLKLKFLLTLRPKYPLLMRVHPLNGVVQVYPYNYLAGIAHKTR